MILGFVLAAFMGTSSLGIALLGLVIALVYYNFKGNTEEDY